jgi:cell shape-determining protein MreD
VIRFIIATILLLLAAFAAQQLLPAFTGLHHSRVLLVHLTFLCCAVGSGQPLMLLLAFIGGFLWDAQCTLSPHPGDLTVYTQPTESLRFGYSILLFGLAGYLMHFIRPFFRDGRWLITTVIIGLTLMLCLTLESSLVSFIRGELEINRPTFLQILFTSIFTAALAPLLLVPLRLISPDRDQDDDMETVQRINR